MQRSVVGRVHIRTGGSSIIVLLDRPRWALEVRLNDTYRQVTAFFSCWRAKKLFKIISLSLFYMQAEKEEDTAVEGYTVILLLANAVLLSSCMWIKHR